MYADIMKLLNKRMLFAEELAAPFTASIGCHIINLYQRESKKALFVTKGIREDMRLPVAIVSPAGFSKSYTMKQFADPTFGILPFKSVFRGKLTEAGLIGTVSRGETILGDAHFFRDGFICFNEISSLFLTAQAEHSAELVNQLLVILSEGIADKRLAGGTVHYDTDVTIWGGTQFCRFDFSQGLGRRFLFVTKAWDEDDIQALKLARKDKTRETYDAEAKGLREKLNNLRLQFDIDEIRFEDKIFECLNEVCDTPALVQKLEKFLIGKAVLEWDGGEILKVSYSEETKDIVRWMVTMEKYVAEGGDLSLLLNILSKGPKSMEYMWNMMRKFGYTLDRFLTILHLALQRGVIRKVIGQTNIYELKMRR